MTLVYHSPPYICIHRKLTNDIANFQMLMYENRMIPMMQYSLK